MEKYGKKEKNGEKWKINMKENESLKKVKITNSELKNDAKTIDFVNVL